MRSVFNFQFSIFKKKGRDDNTGESGVILIGALITMVFFMVVTLSIIEFSTNHYASARRSLVALDSLSVAEAGTDYFMQQINEPGSTYTGTGGEYTFYNDDIRGKGTYDTTITNGSIAGEKIITSTGRIYLPKTAATPLVTRKVRAIITQAVAPAYTVQSGPGGLNLNSNVHIASGPVYVGGKLSMSGNASIGAALLPVNVYAEDVACPAAGGATYPTGCAGSPPYTITTAANNRIYGNVFATNGVDVPGRVSGTISNSVPAINFPVIDHAAVTTAHGWTTSAASSVSCFLGLGTIAANTHFTNAGGVSVPVNCNATVNGDVWSDGPVTLGANSSLIVLGSLVTQPKIIIDGYGASGSFVTSANNALVGVLGFEILTYYSFAASGNSATACSPTCTTLTGSELFNSQNHDTIAIGNNFSAAIGTTFYARWTGLSISNNTTVGQLLGQKITLNSNGTIIFSGAGGVTGTGSWNVKYWEQLFK
jgi:hypothetical protein